MTPGEKSKRAMMALFDPGHRLPLPGGYWIEKSDDNHWQVGGPMGGNPNVYLAMHIAGNVPVGEGGSMDSEIKKFAEAINAACEDLSATVR